MDEAVKCQVCGRERTPEDRDYSPMQVFLGQKLGWYSGDDGELCGADLQNILDNQ